MSEIDYLDATEAVKKWAVKDSERMGDEDVSGEAISRRSKVALNPTEYCGE